MWDKREDRSQERGISGQESVSNTPALQSIPVFNILVGAALAAKDVGCGIKAEDRIQKSGL
jgi:hypothetical protein